MSKDDLVIAIRDQSLNEVGVLDPHMIEEASFNMKGGGVGSWKIVFNDHYDDFGSILHSTYHLLSTGGGINAYYRGELFFSGPVTLRENKKAPQYERRNATVEGVSDDVILAGILHVADPSEPDFTKQTRDDVSLLNYDVANYRDLLKAQMIDLSDTHPRKQGWRQHLRIGEIYAGSAGFTRITVPAFTSLLSIWDALGLHGNLFLRVRWGMDEVTGPGLYVDILDRDSRISGEFRAINGYPMWSVENGQLSESSTADGPYPAVTSVVGGVDGIATATASGSIDDDHRLLQTEVFASASGSAAELEQKAAEVVSARVGSRSGTVAQHRVGDVIAGLGGRFTTDLGDVAVVRDATISLSASGLQASAQFDSADTESWESMTGATLDAHGSRLDLAESRLHPLGAGGRLGASSKFVPDFDDATATGFYNGKDGETANVPSSVYANWFVETHQDVDGRIIQTAHPHNSQSARYVRKSPDGGATWGPWIVMQRERHRDTLTGSSFRGGFTLGNGSAHRDEWVADGVVHQALTINVGSSTQVTGDIEVYCGWGTIAGGTALMGGNGRYIRSGRIFDMSVTIANNIAIIRLRKDDSGGGWVEHVPAGSISSWNAGSTLNAQWSFPAT